MFIKSHSQRENDLCDTVFLFFVVQNCKSKHMFVSKQFIVRAST